MTSEKNKEEEVYDENAVDGYTGFENIVPTALSPGASKGLMDDFMRQSQPQNPLGDMIKGLTSMVTGRPMSQKLTLSGMVGESQISIEITDDFTATMAHEIINRIMDEKKGKENEKKGKSEQDIFEAMMKDSKKSKILD
jgi:hypothetical protein